MEAPAGPDVPCCSLEREARPARVSEAPGRPVPTPVSRLCSGEGLSLVLGGKQVLPLVDALHGGSRRLGVEGKEGGAPDSRR